MPNLHASSRRPSPASRKRHRYSAVWRWHFYIGLLVLPFLFILAFSGMLMLLGKPLDKAMHHHLEQVQPQGERLPAETLLQAVQREQPNADVTLYLPPASPDSSARFALKFAEGGAHGGHGDSSIMAYVNPYTGKLLGLDDPAHSLYARIKELHGSLYLGTTGDVLLEAAAGLGLLMLISGLYLAWPNSGWRSLLPSPALAGREKIRRWHLAIGVLITLPLLFFLISGLAWTSLWGGKLVQPWGSLPGTDFTPSAAMTTHDERNATGIHRVPWTLEQTPMPQSRQRNGNNVLSLNQVVLMAHEQGFGNFRVHIPQSRHDVWTISATTMAGDITRPGGERILHLDPATGRALADIRFGDYPAMGQAMAASIPFHQGDLGIWNWLFNLLLSGLIIALLATGTMLWYKRRPRLSRPRAKPRATQTVGGIMLLIALIFPLSAAAMASIIVFDWAYTKFSTPGRRPPRTPRPTES